jgi:hypothetical protein
MEEKSVLAVQSSSDGVDSMVITRRENKRDVIWFVLLKVF